MKLQVIAAAAALALVAIAPAHASEALAKQYACVACHNVKGAMSVGPTCADVAKKYAGQKDVEAKLAEKVKTGGTAAAGGMPLAFRRRVARASATG